MKRFVRAWLMRRFNLVSAEYATSLRERVEELEDDVCRLRADLAEGDDARRVLRLAVDDCRRNHWKGAFALALQSLNKTQKKRGT